MGEVLRTYLFTGFPWLLLGSGYVDSPLAAWAPIGGVYLLSLMVALSGALGLNCCFAASGGHSPPSGYLVNPPGTPPNNGPRQQANLPVWHCYRATCRNY
ncbi:hypothetical protein HORIV_48150 [Vreelandella olivaria]|uniref:Apolipoprotein N-acyltransferase N-terminal domain-containing protein n=1 Tax=Vreelandella olivaria TaxID=390919 RepID=A0ABN5WZI9_9GAMM|nr:hypothetical protein HORIV_48150 [Halomonas olivaria]